MCSQRHQQYLRKLGHKYSRHGNAEDRFYLLYNLAERQA